LCCLAIRKNGREKSQKYLQSVLRLRRNVNNLGHKGKWGKMGLEVGTLE
jgi:hypothetical protein